MTTANGRTSPTPSARHQSPSFDGVTQELLDEAVDLHEAEGTKQRLFSEDLYRAGSWEHERRVVYKAEAMERGQTSAS
jgi:hypothetical protein